MRSQRPHTLTPREREVLGLIRIGLTNEEIAQRLGITLDGAKYHVSQILSKLGVSTRDEAAAVVRTERPWWLRAAVWAKIGGAATVAAAVAGLAVLAWGVVRTDSASDGPRDPKGLLTPNRDRLAVCVEAVDLDSAIEAQALVAVQKTLDEAADHPEWERLGYDTGTPIVETGCPSGSHHLFLLATRAGPQLHPCVLSRVRTASNQRPSRFRRPHSYPLTPPGRSTRHPPPQPRAAPLRPRATHFTHIFG